MTEREKETDETNTEREVKHAEKDGERERASEILVHWMYHKHKKRVMQRMKTNKKRERMIQRTKQTQKDR